MSGFSDAGLDRLSQGLADQVERGVVAGLTALVARGDAVHVVTAGLSDLDARVPMRRDSLFRIASMTKPITAAAALMLVEAGLLQLDAPIEHWLPELADRRVLRRLDGPLDDTVPAKRSITLRDLLNFTFGFGVLVVPGNPPIRQAIDEAGLAPGPNSPAMSLDARAAAYGALPLIHQPGEGWMYNSGTELVAVAVERAAGRPFEQFLQDRIFAPLGMKDTGFGAVARERLAGCYQVGEAGGFVRWPGSDASPRPGGSTGLISSVDDYLAFARMLLAGGETILSRRSVEAMTSDQLTPAQKAASFFIPGFFEGRGWGFGLGVTTDPTVAPPRGYGWDGGLGTSWRTDPSSGLIGILLTQRPMTSPQMTETATAFWRLAYAAVA